MKKIDIRRFVDKSVRGALSRFIRNDPTTHESLASSLTAAFSRSSPNARDVRVSFPYEEQTEEEKIVREVMEEPLDPGVVVVSATYQHFAPMQYINLELRVGDPEK